MVAISHDTMHLIAGTAIWIIACIILRRPINAWVPLLVAIAAALLNEAVDLWVELWPSPGRQLGEGAKDALLTIAVPVLFFVAARVSPAIFRLDRRRPSRKAR